MLHVSVKFLSHRNTQRVPKVPQNKEITDKGRRTAVAWDVPIGKTMMERERKGDGTKFPSDTGKVARRLRVENCQTKI